MTENERHEAEIRSIMKISGIIVPSKPEKAEKKEPKAPKKQKKEDK
jgi:hypothetical protein